MVCQQGRSLTSQVLDFWPGLPLDNHLTGAGSTVKQEDSRNRNYHSLALGNYIGSEFKGLVKTSNFALDNITVDQREFVRLIGDDISMKKLKRKI